MSLASASKEAHHAIFTRHRVRTSAGNAGTGSGHRVATKQMKDAIIGILLTAALIALFSAYAPILPTQTACGVYPTMPGEGEITLPGGGAGAAEMMANAEKHSSTKQGEQCSVESETVDGEENRQRENKEQSNRMNEIIIAFWHGVAAVLIGEACALALVVANEKNRRNHKERE